MLGVDSLTTRAKTSAQHASSHHVRNKLLPSGTCGFSVKTKELEFRPDQTVKPVKIPSKLAQKLKENELF